MKHVNEVALFPMGRIVMTRGAMEKLSADETLVAIIRHSQGDWGDVCDGDRLANEAALADFSRLFSVYTAMDETKFWIITEHDRSHTTILLPNEY